MSSVILFRRLAARRGWVPRSARRRAGRRGARRHGMPALAALALAALAGALGAVGWNGLAPPGSAVSPPVPVLLRGGAETGVRFAARTGSATGAPPSRGRTIAGGGLSGQVVRVFDGDTFKLDCCARRIRLWGIDAPEWNRRGGPAATAALSALVAGRPLACRQRDIDRYGRIVGQCTLADGSDLGARLMQTGTVREYCHFSRNRYGTC